MHAVACQDRPTAGCGRTVTPVRMGVIVPMVVMRMAMGGPMFMAVVPQLGFVQQKEKHQPQQQRQKQIAGRDCTLKSLWQQLHERCGQQGPCGQTQHVLGVATHHTVAEPCGHPHAANACRQST